MTGESSYKRIQVDGADLNLPDALYFVETQVVLSDEAGEGTSGNNASYRQVEFAPDGTATLVGTTNIGRPAIYAWAEHGGFIPGSPDPQVMIEQVQIPGEGIVFVGSKARSVDLQGIPKRFSYVIENLSSDLGVGSLVVPSTGDINPQFHDVQYHDDVDGLISGEDWTHWADGTSIGWSSESFGDNELGNAIRWGTMYSFSTEILAGQISGFVELRMFKPGGAESVMVPALVPETDPCLADLNGDGSLNFFDVSHFLNFQTDMNGDGNFNFLDVSEFLSFYAAGCP
jgi:hypothetical protein